MTYPPGMLPRSALVEVAPGILLEKVTARAYRRVVAAFTATGHHLQIVDTTSAYRDAALQNAMRAASLTPPGSPDRQQFNLSSTSTISLAAHPNGSHEDGHAMDILIDGSDNPTPAHIALLLKYGWQQQFGEADRNHFKHYGPRGTQPVTRAWCIKHGLYVGAK